MGRSSASRDGRIPKLVKKLADDVVNGGGSFKNVESLGNRKLAFKFSQKQGYVSTFFAKSRFFFILSFNFLSLCGFEEFEYENEGCLELSSHSNGCVL